MSTSNTEADTWFESVEGEHGVLLGKLREFVRSVKPALEEEIKWKQPCYKHNRHVCYLKNTKNHVTLGFQQGAHLPDPKGLLEGAGKDMRHVKIMASQDLVKKDLVALVRAAIAFDEEK